MKTRRLTVLLGLLLFSGAVAAQEKRAFSIKSDPAGATVVMIGGSPDAKPSPVGTTPIVSAVPAYYLSGPSADDPHYLAEPTFMQVAKEGYQPQLTLITTGPFEWTNPDGNKVRYFKVAASEFSFRLESAVNPADPNYRPPPALLPAAVATGYKRAPDAIEQQARDLLQRALAAKTPVTEIDAVFSGAVVCGPRLWKRLKDKADLATLPASVLKIIDPNTKETVDARGFVVSDSKTKFWNAFLGSVGTGSSIVVRRASKNEFDYFWSIIPFDLDEPLYVADIGKQAVLFYFSEDKGKLGIFWVELV